MNYTSKLGTSNSLLANIQLGQTMSIENFSNNYSTTLASGINATDVTLTVTSATNAPLPNFRVLIDTEYILVTAVSGTTFTITRGIEGTIAASHSSGATLTQIVTAQGLTKAITDRAIPGISSGLYSALPTAPSTGQLYLPTDTQFIQEYNGSAWQYFGPVQQIYPPTLTTGWSWLNQQDTTVSTTNNSFYFFSAAGNANTANLRGYIQTAPATPYTITALIAPDFRHTSSTVYLYQVGLGWSSSTAGTIAFSRIVIYNGYPAMLCAQDVDKYNSVTSESGAYGSPIFTPVTRYFWLRIRDDGTNRYAYISTNGLNWYTLLTVGRTDFLTPDRVGLFFLPYIAVNSGFNLISYQVTSP